MVSNELDVGSSKWNIDLSLWRANMQIRNKKNLNVEY
jgi:hypothetical protein